MERKDEKQDNCASEHHHDPVGKQNDLLRLIGVGGGR